MAAGPTYTPIATVSAGGTTTVTFSSIPSSYTDLVLIIGGAYDSQGYAYFSFNNDSGSNYSYNRMLAYSGGLLADAQTSTAGDDAFSLGTSSGTIIANIQNYSNTTAYKTMLVREGYAGVATGLYTYLWRSTSAITSMQITPQSSATWSTGTTLTLYGIAAA